MSNLKNINLDVARFAMKCVNNVKENKSIKSDDYKVLVKKMSTLIQKNGLIGTLVFNLSKVKKEHHKEVLRNIIDWNKENYKISNISNFDKDKMVFINDNAKDINLIAEYIKWITSLKQDEYRLITKEMMNLFGWTKRFADGMIEGEEKDAN